MAGKITITLDGLDALRARFRDVVAESRDAVIDVVEGTVAEVQETAESLAPMDRGDLKGGFYPEFDQDGLGAEVRNTEFYAHMQEWGTVHHPAQPFMTPAAEQARPGFERGMAAALKRAVER